MFNKHFPDRPEESSTLLSKLDRAIFFRLATYISTAMLIVGYVMIWLYWE